MNKYTCPGCGSRDGKDDGQGGCLYCNQPLIESAKLMTVVRDIPPAISSGNYLDLMQGYTTEIACPVCQNPIGDVLECPFCGTI